MTWNSANCFQYVFINDSFLLQQFYELISKSLMFGGIFQNPVTVGWRSYKGLTDAELTNPYFGLTAM